MNSQINPIERLIKTLKLLPGIGEKSATRLAFFFLRSHDNISRDLAQALLDVKSKVRLCPQCFDMTDLIPCRICRDTKRDSSMVCIVEEPKDVKAVEGSGCFNGKYHILHGAISPMDGIGPEELKCRELIERVKRGEIREVIIATNPTVEGEATAHYLAESLEGFDIRVTRIAFGLPVGGNLEYSDRITVGRSLINRKEIQGCT